MCDRDRCEGREHRTSPCYLCRAVATEDAATETEGDDT